MGAKIKLVIEKANINDRSAILEIMKYWNMHHIPSVEMESLNLSTFFVARINGQVIGASGYKLLSSSIGKTTLLGIHPDFVGNSIGRGLQDIRLKTMYSANVTKVITNADRPETILWYKKHYQYREIGKLKKLCDFGVSDIDHWTTLELDLKEHFKNKEKVEAEKEAYVNLNSPVPLAKYSPLVINVCLTGMVPTKNTNPYVPISVDEVIESAIKVYDLGARIVHLHARNKDGIPISDASFFARVISNLHKERPGLVCCSTTSGRGGVDFEERAEVLSLTGLEKPDMASLTLGSLNFLTGTSANSIITIERLAMRMKENNIKPELEVFDTGMINLAKYLERHGLIYGKKYFNIMLGNLNTAPASMSSLSSLVGQLPSDSMWAAAGLGDFQLPMNTLGIVANGHVRVGIEDSIYYDYGKNTYASNEELVKRIVRIANEIQRPIASAADTHSMLGLAGVE